MVLRRYAWQIGGVATAAAVVAVLVTLSLRGSGTGTHAGATPTIRASASATADPRVEQVKAIARAFVTAEVRSAATGDASPLNQLTTQGSQAQGNAGASAAFSRDAHHNFVASRIDVREASWTVGVFTDRATATIVYALYGHDADWPSLRPRESDHETSDFRQLLSMELTNGIWLVDELH